MDRSEIERRIREILAGVTTLPVDKVSDAASFRKELSVDSLTLIEIGVDLEHAFRLGLSEEELQGLDSIRQTVDVVAKGLEARRAADPTG